MKLDSVSLLTIVFVILKLTGYIQWSWWWVFSPLWITIIIYFIFSITAAVTFAVIAALRFKRNELNPTVNHEQSDEY